MEESVVNPRASLVNPTHGTSMLVGRTESDDLLVEGNTIAIGVDDNFLLTF
jgi:hypothetical protein